MAILALPPSVEKFLTQDLDWSKVPDYHQYFGTILPATDADFFRRGLFALSSVHTTWAMNCELYSKLWSFESWRNDPVRLRRLIADSRAGLTNNRTRFFTKFAETFWADPLSFRRKADEPWESLRERIEQKVLGLGVAKSAFYVELCYFHEAEIACGDTHLLQDYGYTTSQIGKRGVKTKEVLSVQQQWVEACKAHGIDPVTARWMRWDQKQGRKDCRYWSYVLEGRPPTQEDPQFWLFKELAA